MKPALGIKGRFGHTGARGHGQLIAVKKRAEKGRRSKRNVSSKFSPSRNFDRREEVGNKHFLVAKTKQKHSVTPSVSGPDSWIENEGTGHKVTETDSEIWVRFKKDDWSWDDVEAVIEEKKPRHIVVMSDNTKGSELTGPEESDGINHHCGEEHHTVSSEECSGIGKIGEGNANGGSRWQELEVRSERVGPDRRSEVFESCLHVCEANQVRQAGAGSSVDCCHSGANT